MSKSDPQFAKEVLAKLFVADEHGPEAARVVEAGRADPEVRSLFDRLAFADRELRGTDEPAEFEHTFRDAQIMGALDAMLEDENSQDEDENSQDNVVPLADRRASGVARAGALIAAAAAMLLVIQPILERRGEDEFGARSATTVSPGEYQTPQIAVYCVHETGREGAVFRSAADFDLGVVRCPVDAQIKLAYRNVDERLKWAGFVGVLESGRVLWYGPTPAADAAVAIGVGPDTKPVLETIRLSVNHDVEDVRVHGVFSETPMDHDRLTTWIERQRANGFRQNLEAPMDGVTTSMVFEVASAEGIP